LDANQKKPWFLYLAENNVHGPTVASEAYYQKFAEMTPVQKQHYAADIAEVDDAIGGIMNKLRELNLETNTLVFFLSDNGKSSPYGEEGDLRGQKWTTWEGGIRIPFVIQWKGRISGGQVTHVPAIQLDVFPTAIAAAGGSVLPEWKLDGVNLLPWLESKTTKLEPRPFYWRFGPQYAVRQGDWKIVKPSPQNPAELYDLRHDPGERTNLAGREPDRLKQLTKLMVGARVNSPDWHTQP
jgi:arylsulfatase A-like enzyme